MNLLNVTTTKYHKIYLITTQSNTNIVCIVKFFRCEMVCPKISLKEKEVMDDLELTLKN